MSENKKKFWEEVVPKDKRKFKKDDYKRVLQLFSFTKPYRLTFFIGFIFLILSTATTLVFPKLIGEMTKVMEEKSSYTLNQVTIFFACLILLQGVFSFFRVYLFSIVSEKTTADIRKSVYNKIITLPIPFFENNRVGELISRITSDVSAFQGILTTTLAEFFRQIATLIIGVSILFYISWKLTLIMLSTFPIIIIFALVFGRYIRVLARKVQLKLSESNVVVSETLSSISIVKAFTNEKIESKRYGSVIDQVVDLSIKAAVFRSGFVTFFIVGLFGGVVFVIWYGGALVVKNELLLSDLITFLFYTAFIGGSISGLGDIFTQLQRTVGASERLLEIMDMDSEVSLEYVKKENPIKGDVSFNNINFSYPSRKDVAVLKDIEVSVNAGQQIAFVGPSGAGKSTIAQLLIRFYELEEGSITIDGKDISPQDLSFLRQNIAIVPQEVILFGGSIKENIIYGRPGATDAEVYAAAEKANALEFINGFPEKFETLVGENGIKLSGGQKQRIAIARAILKDPKILILDEATSALDSASERLVQNALDQLMKGRTSLVIAHRLSTIRNSDCIYVIDQGQIKEKGTHEELILKKEGIYANLVKLQFEAHEFE